MHRHGSTVGLLLAALAFCSPALAQSSTGPDVIVGDLTGPGNFTDVGLYDAFSIGTTSCNIGDTPLSWVGGNNQHPVIAQNLYRLLNGRFEQIGLSWLKHGFTALTGSLCDPCGGPGGSILSPGCSDPYTSGLNGSQSNLGPRWEVNASTGYFPYPYTESNTGATGDSVYKRVKTRKSDIAAGGTFIMEGQYVSPDDAAAGNRNNNASWRECSMFVSGSGYSASFAGPTVRTQPAIFAWQAFDPTVELAAVDVPGDGRIWVGLKQTPAGGGMTTYEYAVHNLNSHRGVGGFRVTVGGGATVTNIGFHDVEHHSASTAQIQDGTDWTSGFAGGDVSWNVAGGSNNAVNWGTLYNFRFDSDSPPGNPELTLFLPGSPTSVTVPIGPQEFEYSFPNGNPSDLIAGATFNMDFVISDVNSTHDPSSVDCLVSVNGSPFSSNGAGALGGGAYRTVFPSLTAGDTLDYYFTADETGGGVTLTSPALAPGNFYSVTAIPAPVAITPGMTHLDDFESGPGAWTPTNAVWEHGVPTAGTINAAFSGNNVFATTLAGTYANSQLGSIEATFDCTSLPIDPQFSMRIWHETESGWDGANVELDTGSGFQVVGSTLDPSWYNETGLDAIGGADGWGDDSGGYVLVTHGLPGAAGNIIDVRVTFGSDDTVIGGDGIAVDDVSIFAPMPTGGQPSTPGFGTLDVNGSALNAALQTVASGNNGIYHATVNVGDLMLIEIGGEPGGQPAVLFLGRALEMGVPIPPFGAVDLDPLDLTLPLVLIANGLANPPGFFDVLMHTDGAGVITLGATATYPLLSISPFGLSAINVTPNNGGITITNTVDVDVNP